MRLCYQLWFHFLNETHHKKLPPQSKTTIKNKPNHNLNTTIATPRTIMQNNKLTTVAVYNPKGYPIDDDVVVNGTISSPTTANNNSYAAPAAPPTVIPMVVKPKYIHIGQRRPVTLTYCPNCVEKNVQTRTKTKANGITWLCVGAGVFIFWPLCWIPLCVDDMKQTNHYCTKCGTKIGRVKPFQ